MILASFTTIHMVYSVWLVAVGTFMPSDYVVECASELCVGPGVVGQTWASSPATSNQPIHRFSVSLIFMSKSMIWFILVGVLFYVTLVVDAMRDANARQDDII